MSIKNIVMTAILAGVAGIASAQTVEYLHMEFAPDDWTHGVGPRHWLDATVTFDKGFDSITTVSGIFDSTETIQFVNPHLDDWGNVLPPVANKGGAELIVNQGHYRIPFTWNVGTGSQITDVSGYLLNQDSLSQNEMTVGWVSSVSGVPEPETYAMLLAGLGLVGFTARRRATARTAA
ncbi:FxDxF family PEP-CTERM protein [Janthinobacterium sp.]|uniref:FxDxF family PEP-CTERM protein n=1 Tax=Janthinobacterium sp. TaxID=1871054 RepID=UPI00293D3B7C|nr:FxDxF family PEP-CTERM protein [Janthinobacterium sp.]